MNFFDLTKCITKTLLHSFFFFVATQFMLKVSVTDNSEFGTEHVLHKENMVEKIEVGS